MMKRNIVTFILSFVFVLYFTGLAYAPGDSIHTFSSLSKIYILYENGESQVIEIDPPIDYSYHVDDNGVSDTTGDLELLVSGELEQDSNISKIALWIESFTLEEEGGGGESDTFPVQGYYGLDPSQGGDDGEDVEDWIRGYTEITSWFSGTNRQGTAGVVNFNSDLELVSGDGGSEDDIYRMSDKDSFNASNKSITLKIRTVSNTLKGSDIETSDL